MKRIFIIGLAISLLAGATNVGTASIWNNLLGMNQITTFEDQDRESIVDVNLDGVISGREGPDLIPGTADDVPEGDAFFGLLRFDNRTLPAPNVPLAPDHPYAIFAFELVSLTVAAIDTNGDLILDTRLYNGTFAAQTGAIGTALGLDLNSLTGGKVAAAGLPIAVGAQTSGVAVYEDVGVDLLDNAVPDTAGVGAGFSDTTDWTGAAAAGTLDLIGGIGPGVGNPNSDFMASSFTFYDPTGVFPTDPNSLGNITALNTATLVGGSIGTSNSFNMALTVQFTNGPIYLPMVPIFNPLLGAYNNHELTVVNGQVTGASDLAIGLGGGNGVTNSSYFGTYVHPVTLVGYDFYGVSTNADANVYHVPEPSSVLIWCTLGLGLLGLARRRRKK